MYGLETRSSGARSASATPDATSPLLLVEDDVGDAFLVRELLLEAGIDCRSSGYATCRRRRGDRDLLRCVLLDLGLPDAVDTRTGWALTSAQVAPSAPSSSSPA